MMAKSEKSVRKVLLNSLIFPMTCLMTPFAAYAYDCSAVGSGLNNASFEQDALECTSLNVRDELTGNLINLCASMNDTDKKVGDIKMKLNRVLNFEKRASHFENCQKAVKDLMTGKAKELIEGAKKFTGSQGAEIGVDPSLNPEPTESGRKRSKKAPETSDPGSDNVQTGGTDDNADIGVDPGLTPNPPKRKFKPAKKAPETSDPASDNGSTKGADDGENDY